MISESEILGARILVIGDQESSLLLCALLSEAGYTCVESTANPTANPPGAGELHEIARYDLIVLDLEMAVIDGLALIEALKAHASHSEFPLLVLVAQPGDRLRALRAGAKDFVGKPFDPVEIRTRIHNMLEMRLLYKSLEKIDQDLERTVEQRTAELRENEARYRRLTELASDWYWEQDESGNFTRVYGPVLEMLGIARDSTAKCAAGIDAEGWNEAERAALRAAIASRRPFIDFVFTRTLADGTQQKYQVSGEPTFGPGARFTGYCGVGIELSAGK